MTYNNCYQFKKYIFNDNLFENVQATYIIHLENNGRLSSIENQLSQYHPTKDVYILFNKGFKKCQKETYIDKPPLDLIDAFITIFKDAYHKKYENILILEDDFIFHENIKDKKTNITNHIDNFLYKKRNEEFIYSLGVIPYLQTHSFDHTNSLFLSTGSHGNIYSNQFIKNILNKDKKEIKDWDVYLNFNYFWKRYCYHMPVCYQLFPETENAKYWSRNNTYIEYIVQCFHFLKRKLKLDIQPEPGYSIMYSISKILFWILIIILFFIFYKIIYFLWKMKEKSNKKIKK